MKKHWKTLMLTAATAAVFSCGVSAFAVSDIHADILSGRVYTEGRRAYCWDASGKEVDYLSYNGTTYIPIRTAGEWMGKNIAWDEASKTITLSGTTTKIIHDEAGTYNPNEDDAALEAAQNGISAKLRDDITVVVDQKTQTFKNAAGETVYPINYNNTNYLPVRNIGELCGMTINYREKDSRGPAMIFLRTPMTDAQINAGKNYVDTVATLFTYEHLAENGNVPEHLKKQYTPSANTSSITGTNGSTDKENNIFLLMKRNYDQTTIDDVKQYAEISKQIMQAVLDVPKPDAPVLDYYYDQTVTQAKAAITSCDTVLKAIADGKDEKTCRDLMFSDAKGLSVIEQCFRANETNNMRIVLLEQY